MQRRSTSPIRRRPALPRAAALAGLLAAALALGGCTAASQAPAATPEVVPAPVRLEAGDGAFRMDAGTRFVANGPGAADAVAVFAEQARRATGFELPVAEGEAGDGDIEIAVDGPGDDMLPAEDHTLDATPERIRIHASTPAGAFRATQTLRQLLPADIEREDRDPAGGWTVPAASIADEPRFAYRAALLDVARHFFAVDDVLDHIDRIALLKLNVLHLHLTDDQGWRIRIDSWPRLTEIGASTSAGGDGGGFYTKDDYRRIVDYAAERYVTIVPEIDLPGHTNAALSAYPELNCDGVAPPPYEGIEVGFSSLCAAPERAEATDRFLADVTREVAEMTPGPWLHLGGDESYATSPADYLDLVRRMTTAGAATGKTIIGYHEMGASRELPPGTVGQYWDFVVEPRGEAPALARSFVEQGGSVILMPADVAYLDMFYPDDPDGPLGGKLGLRWAGPTTLEEAYGWDPATAVDGIAEQDVLGIAAATFTETIRAVPELEFMVFPRIAAIAEVAWSPAAARDEADFAVRLASFGTHLDALGVSYRRVGGVPWEE